MKFLPIALLTALSCEGVAAFVAPSTFQQSAKTVETSNAKNQIATSTTPAPRVTTALFESSDDDSADEAEEEDDESSAQDDEPSDVNTEFEVPASDANSLSQLLALAARTGRGEFATKEERDAAMELVESLETTSEAGVMWGDEIYGRWELVYSSTQLFRSSPFFMAGRAVCTTEDQAKQYNWFCDMHRKALAISQIGAVRQIVSPSRLISEFEVKAGAVPFVGTKFPFRYSGGWPVTIDGAIVSSADLDTTDEGDAWEISMDTVEIKGSNLPGLRQILDSGLKLPSRQLGSFLENNVAGYTNPKPIFETTYLGNDIRISRDQDNNVFVYSKVSSNMDPTDYSAVMPDLGVTKLLEGFNDAITKFYL